MEEVDKRAPRVTGALLQNFIGKQVCLCGYATETDSSGLFFKMRTTDKVNVTVQLEDTVSDAISGLVEVYAKVKNPSAVQCHSFLEISSEYTEKFSTEKYDQAVQLMHENSHYYYASNAD